MDCRITIILSRLFEIGHTELLTTLVLYQRYMIFQGYFLGFVASVQVAINDMVRIGDWITMVWCRWRCNRNQCSTVKFEILTIRRQRFLPIV
jgi:hypothetical protein